MSKTKRFCLVLALLVGAGTTGAVVAEASTPKPSGYCSKKEAGKTAKYTTPSKSATYTIKCVSYTAYHWKKA